MQSKDLVVIRTYLNEMMGEMARMALERCGIDAVIMKDDAGGMYPYLQLATGVRLVVKKEQAEEASAVLNELEQTGGSATPEDSRDE